ncbi:hypothetical protein C8J56DRAFT_786960 [Mycena floridula]|nr:hypothetical protein C8J56DRAFT_786960 [Mycena floridula]
MEFDKKTVSSVLTSKVFICACIGTITSSILSIIVFSYDYSASLRVPSSWGTESNNLPLRRPSPYINLNRVPINSSSAPLPSIFSFAHVVLQFQNSDPLRALKEDSRWYPSDVGEIYPDDRHFLVSEQISTVMQFRNLDYGMEKCHLNPTVPDANSTSFQSSIDIDLLSEIDVWMLDSSQEISKATRSSPPRRSHFAKIDFSAAHNYKSIEFRCPSNSFTTFEFTCSSTVSNCHVEFWQRESEHANGTHLYSIWGTLS